ncbi:hypothetical protein PT2222_60126 [Paraburkholderia tropica]
MSRNVWRARRGSSCDPSRLQQAQQAQLFEIEFGFDAMEHGVVDLARAMQAQQRLARHAHEFEFDAQEALAMRDALLARGVRVLVRADAHAVLRLQAFEHRGLDGVGALADCVERLERRAERARARFVLGHCVARGRTQLQQTDQQRETAALHDQRGDDQQEGAEHDHVAAREIAGQGQRRGEADHAAHARPAHHGGFGEGPGAAVDVARAVRVLRVVCTGCAQASRQPDRNEHPHEPRDDSGGGCGQRHAQAFDHDRAFVIHARENAVQREADQHEHERVEHEHDRFPRRLGLDAHVGAEHAMLADAEHESAGDDRKHARAADGFGDAIARPRHREAQHDAEHRIDEAREHPAHRLAADETDRDAEQNQREEQARALRDGDRGRGERRRHRDLVDQQARGVVDEALAFEHGDEARGQRIALQDRFRGDRVGRRDDRAEREARGPRQGGIERMHGEGDRDGRERHRAEHERDDRAQLAAKLLPRRVERTRHQQRRQHGREQQVGVHVRHALACHRDHAAAEQQHDGGRYRQAFGEPGERARAADQQQQVMKKLDVAHARAASTSGARAREGSEIAIIGFPCGAAARTGARRRIEWTMKG